MAATEDDVFEVTPDEDVIDTDDGGAIVSLGDDDKEIPTPSDNTEFYRNLADEIPTHHLEMLADQLKKAIDQDRKDREDRDQQQAEAIKRTGIGGEAPGGASFMGASKAVHPMLAKAAIDFGSRMIAELFPPEGPVRDYIPGEATQARVDKARRKVAYMNWQFKIQMPEAYNELEQMLVQDVMGGSQYIRIVWDARRKRPFIQFIPIDDVYLPFAATNYYTSERITYAERITQLEFENRVRSGMYLDLKLPSPSNTPDRTESEKASDRIEGKSQSPYNNSGARLVYLTQSYLEIEKDGKLVIPGEERGEGSKDLEAVDPLPYLISLDEHNGKILSIVRNWEEEDKQFEPIHWMTDFPFLAWRGAVGASLGQVIGSLAGAATGALRALLDSAHINNIPTLLKLKGANMPGQSIETGVGQIIEIEGGVAPDQDIRKLLMAIPYNEPSLVLLQLLGFLGDSGESVVRTTFEKFVESGRPDMPVGTTLALIEQGMKVLAGIHKRMHASMDRLIRHLHRINKMYVTDDEIKNDTGEMLAKRSDFTGPLDVVPTSDPEIFSDVQRFAQLQLVSQRSMQLPMLYDLRKVEELILTRTKIPNAKELLVPSGAPKEMNAINENMAMSLGQGVAAFPEQDQLAHIQVHVDFWNSPMFGKNPVIIQKFAPRFVAHLVEHILFWYVTHTVEVVSEAAGEDIGTLMKYRDPQTRAELDRALASASKGVLEDAQGIFAKLPPIIQEAFEIANKIQQGQLPQDPASAAAVQIAQMDNATRNREIESREQLAMAKEQTSAGKIKADMGDHQLQRVADAANEQLRQESENRRGQLDRLTKERMNVQDNMTALTIADAEVQSKEKVAVSKGTGVDPGSDSP